MENCTCGDGSKKCASEEEMFCVTLRTGYRFGTCTARCCDSTSPKLVYGGEFQWWSSWYGAVTYRCPEVCSGIWKERFGTRWRLMYWKKLLWIYSWMDSYENSVEYQLWLNPFNIFLWISVDFISSVSFWWTILENFPWRGALLTSLGYPVTRCLTAWPSELSFVSLESLSMSMMNNKSLV